MGKFEDSVYKFIVDNDMINPGERIVVGLSGGADSVSLLLVLYALRRRLEITESDIFAVHINHLLRGEAADADEAFARQLCERLKVNFISYRKDIRAYSKEMGMTVEEAGRDYRYKCFEQTAKDFGCEKIAVAHNKNDLAETVLFNIARGTGLRGLAGIKATRGEIIRPLLDTARDEIEAYLVLKNQEFRTDETNLTLDYDRNKIRHVILPELLSINQGALTHICQMAEEAYNSYSFIHHQALNDFDENIDCDGFGRTVTFDMDRLFKLGPVLQEHLVHEAIGKVAGQKKDITRRHIMAVVGLIYQDTGKQVELPYDIRARRSYNRLIISNKPDNRDEFYYEIENKTDNFQISCDIPWGKLELCVRPWNGDEEPVKKTYTKMVDYGKIKDTICIRTPEDGDYIVIDSAGNTKKLSRVFIDRKIDREKRAHWPVVACGNEILWAVGLRYNEAYRVDSDTTKILYMNCIGKGE